jgi:hypothetical protein
VLSPDGGRWIGAGRPCGMRQGGGDEMEAERMRSLGEVNPRRGGSRDSPWGGGRRKAP